MMALDLRGEWRTVEHDKPWRPLILTFATAFAVAGGLLLQQPTVAEAAPAPSAPVVTVAPPAEAKPELAPEPPPPPAARAAAPRPKKKRATASSPEERTRRALLRLQRAQLDASR